MYNKTKIFLGKWNILFIHLKWLAVGFSEKQKPDGILGDKICTNLVKPIIICSAKHNDTYEAAIVYKNIFYLHFSVDCS